MKRTSKEHVLNQKLPAKKNEYTWKERFKNLLGNHPKVTYKPITKIINNQLDIKFEQFMQDEPNVVLTKIKNQKSCRSW